MTTLSASILAGGSVGREGRLVDFARLDQQLGLFCHVRSEAVETALSTFGHGRSDLCVTCP